MTVYSPAIRDYIAGLFASEDEILRRIRLETVEAGLPDIAIEPESGRFLQLLAAACRARRAVEIGALGGYSGVWILRGMEPGGRLITLEQEPRHAEVARRHFALAGLAEQVDLRLGNAHHLLPGLASEGPFDFVFIDAEKAGYLDYYEWAVANLRPGGILTAHNTLWGGSVVGDYDGPAIADIRRFNRHAAADPRVLSTIYPAGDGTLAAVKILP
jgi:caffeoyl-CoA O-methyltransferase